MQFAKRVEPFDIAWFEEPVAPEDYAGFSTIGMQTSIPIAADEQEYRVHGFRDLIVTGAVGIIQPDARWMGGVTEFMKVAAVAQAQGLTIAAHGPQHIHLPLKASAMVPPFVSQEERPMASLSLCEITTIAGTTNSADLRALLVCHSLPDIDHMEAQSLRSPQNCSSGPSDGAANGPSGRWSQRWRRRPRSNWR